MGIGGQTAAGDGAMGVSDVTILQGWKMANGNRMAAVAVTLEPGWKTYWRAPGSAGIPPRLRLNGSQNVKQIAIHWPVPTVSKQFGETVLTYSNQLILPVEITPKNGANDIQVSGKFDFGVCKDVCLPLTANLTATITPNTTANAKPIKASLNKLVKQNIANGIKATCDLSIRSNGMLVSATLRDMGFKADHIAFEYANPETYFAGGALEQTGTKARAQIWALNSHGGPITLARDQLRLTVFGDGKAVEIQGCRKD